MANKHKWKYQDLSWSSLRQWADEHDTWQFEPEDVVRLIDRGRYCQGETNPSYPQYDMTGVVTAGMSNSNQSGIRVIWDNGKENGYDYGDLILEEHFQAVLKDVEKQEAARLKADSKSFKKAEERVGKDLKESAESFEVKLYYKEGKRIMWVKVPKLIEKFVSTGKRKIKSNDPEAPEAETEFVSRAWKDADGDGLVVYKTGVLKPEFLNSCQKHGVSIESFGEGMGMTNFSILRVKGISSGVNWDVSSIKIIDVDLLKWAEALNKFIILVMKASDEGRKYFKIETTFKEI